MSTIINSSNVSEVIGLHVATESGWAYQRILRIIETDGTEHTGSYVDQYDPDDIEVLELPLTLDLSQRLTEFFDGYVASEAGQGYNCHRFALWMSGIDIPVAEDGYCTEIVTPVVDAGKRHEGFLRLGQMGVIGHKIDGESRALHSVIGLGEDRPECLQVMGVDGYLTIDTYDNILDLYCPDELYDPDCKIPNHGFGLYASRK